MAGSHHTGELITRSLVWDEGEIRDYGDAAVAVGRHTQQASYRGNTADGSFRITPHLRPSDRTLAARGRPPQRDRRRAAVPVAMSAIGEAHEPTTDSSRSFQNEVWVVERAPRQIREQARLRSPCRGDGCGDAGRHGCARGLALLAFATAGSRLTDQPGALRVMLMGLSMTVPMVLWMRHRGHSASRNVEMAASMLVPSGVAAALAAARVLGAGMALAVHHAVMVPAMLGVMLWRYDEYERPHVERQGFGAPIIPPAARVGAT